MPIAAMSRGPRCSNGTPGNAGVGNPLGNDPTVATPLAARSKTAVTTVAPTTATSTAGTLFDNRGKTSRMTRVARPISRAVVFVSLRPETKAFVSSTKPSASVEKPNSLGNCPTRMVIASPFM